MVKKLFFFIIGLAVLWVLFPVPAEAAVVICPGPGVWSCLACDPTGFFMQCPISTVCDDTCYYGPSLCAFGFFIPPWHCKYCYQDSAKPSTGECCNVECTGTGWTQTPNSANCPGGKTCNADCNCVVGPPLCSWQNDGCGMGCDERAMHQTCGPPGCSGGDCEAGKTNCVPNHPSCIPCEETCSCSCPEACPCPLGTGPLGECPKELKGGLVPCGRGCNDPCTKECECCPCTLCHLFVLFKRIVDFLAKDILFPLAVLMIIIGGVIFLTAAGSPERINTAKKILTSTVIGLVIIFLAWLIVDTIIGVLVRTDNPFGMVLRNWSDIPCPISEGAPPSVPICSNLSCQGSQADCKCGTATTTAANPWCCAVSNNVYSSQGTCQADPACAGAPPPSVCSNLSCQGSQADCKCGTAQTTAANPWCCAASNSVYASQANCQADPACANPCGCLCTDCPGVVSPCP